LSVDSGDFVNPQASLAREKLKRASVGRPSRGKNAGHHTIQEVHSTDLFREGGNIGTTVGGTAKHVRGTSFNEAGDVCLNPNTSSFGLWSLLQAIGYGGGSEYCRKKNVKKNIKQRKEAESSGKDHKKVSKVAAANAVVADAILDMEEKEESKNDEMLLEPPANPVFEIEGEVECALDELKEVDDAFEFRLRKVHYSPMKLNSSQRILVNPWAIAGNYNTKNFHFIATRASCTIQGWFEFNGDKRFVSGRFGWYDILGDEPLGVSKCETVIVVDADTASVYIGENDRPLTDSFPFGNHSVRLMRSIKAVIDSADTSIMKDGDYRRLSSKVKAHWKRFYPDYSTLQEDIIKCMSSTWVLEEMEKLAIRRLANHENRLQLKLQHAVQKEGKTWRRAMAEYGRTKFFKSFGKVALATAVAVASSYVTIIPAIYTTLSSFGALAIMEPKIFDYSEETLVREALVARGGTELTYCKRVRNLAVEKSSVDMARVPQDLVEGSAIVTDYVAEDAGGNGNRVDIFGTTVGRGIYPENNAQNIEAALRIRMLFDRTIDDKAMDDLIKYACGIIDTMDEFDVSDVDVYAFLKSQYGTRRADELFGMIDEEVDASSLVYKIFVKGEYYVGKGDEDFKPRMIWSCPDIIIAVFGAYFHKLGKEMCKRFSKFDNLYYVSGATPDEVGAYAARMFEECGQVLESDVSNWDGSMNADILKIEKYFLENKVVGFPEDIKVLFDNWGKNSGVSKLGEVKATSNGGRRSGDLWTSSMNTLLNFLISMWVYEAKSIDDVMIMAMGDDNVVGLRERMTPQLQQEATLRYESIGLKCEIILRETVEETSFCSGMFWNVDGRYRWGNRPLKCMAKLGMNHYKHHPKQFKSLLKGTAKGMLCTAGHVPIIGTLLRTLVATGEDVKARTDNRHLNPYRIQGGVTQYPSMETYQQFANLYGIGIDEILIIEEAIECTINLHEAPYVFDHPIMDYLFEQEFPKYESDGNDTQVYDHPSHVDYELSYKDVVYDTPLHEEAEKLVGVRSLAGAILSGWEYGMEENIESNTTGHEYLHALFSGLSYMNLNWGVAAHSSYNQHVWINKHLVPCKRKKGKINTNKIKLRKGKGWKNTLKSIGKNIMIEGGGMLGSMVPIPGMSEMGKKTGAWLSKVTGMGDYKVNHNTLYNGQVPEFDPANHGIRIKHREYLRDVQGSVDWNTQEIYLNPGLVGSFPWLSKLAGLYSQYRFNGLIFEFISTSADALNSTNTALGTVCQATRYNFYDPTFSSKVEMLAHEFSTSGKPAEDHIHPIECDPSETPFNIHYVRDSALRASEDARLYDWGVYQLSTIGMQAVATIGELWVSYDVTLEKPRLNPTAYPNPLHGRISNALPNSTNPLGPIQRGVGGNMDLVISAVASGFDTITFPNFIQTGRFLVEITISSGASAVWVPTWTNAAVATEGYGYNLDTAWSEATIDDSYQFSQYIDVTGWPVSVTYTYAGATAASIDVYIYQVPSRDQFELRSTALSIEADEEKETADELDDIDYQDYLQWKRKFPENR